MTDRKMDVEVRWRHGGSTTDITNDVISYEREQQICTGIGTLTITTTFDQGRNYTTWDRIVIYEGGTRRGTYFIAEIAKNQRLGTLSIACQDASKKLTDHFIVESYYIDYATYTRTWIEKFLVEAGVDYQFETDSSGNLVSEGSQLGLASCYDVIMNLLQQSGWYMYVDNDNKVHVGDINKDLTNPDFTLRATDITNLRIFKSDKPLRNRAVVWGESNGDEWVYADLYRDTPWDVGPNDLRTVVLSNGNIGSSSAAYSLAEKMLDEFAQLQYEKEIEVAGYHEAEIGDVARVRTKYWSGLGLVTTVGSSLSRTGLVTRMVLDQKCPRLFGFYGFESYVYIGTNGSGVWRKEIGDDTWMAFTTGMDETDVTDLIIKGGVFASTAGGKAYINLNPTFAEWEEYVPLPFEDTHSFAWVTIYVDAVACDIDDETHNIYFGFRLKPEVEADLGYQRSWVDEVDTSGNLLNRYQVYLNDDQDDFKLVDVEKKGSSILPVAEAPASYCPPDVLFGHRNVSPEPTPDMDANCYGPLPSTDDYEDALKYVSSQNGVVADMHIQGTSISLLWTSWVLNVTKFEHHAYDEDDNEFKAEKYFTWPVTYFQGSDNFIPLYRGFSKDDDGNYHIVDVAKFWTTYSSSVNLYVYTGTISGLLNDRPIYKNPVNVATTAEIILYGMQSIDGVVVTPGMRVLVKDQSDASENGIYVASLGIWSRASDLNTSDEFVRGVFTRVLAGTENLNKAYQLDIEDDDFIIVDFTDVPFTEVLILESYGGSLVEISDPTVSLTGFPRDFIMVDGTAYIWITGTRSKSSGIYDFVSYMCIVGDGGMSVTEYNSKEIRNMSYGVTSPFVQTYGDRLVAGGDGVVHFRLYHEINNTGAGEVSDNAQIYLQSFIIGPEGLVDSVDTILDSISDSGLGDWQTYFHPLHGAGTGIITPEITHTGSVLSTSTTPYAKYKFSLSANSWWQCCWVGLCGGPLSTSFDRTETLSTGVVNLLTGEQIRSDSYSRGTYGGSCSEVAYDSWDYDKASFNMSGIIPLNTRSYPTFIYIGGTGKEVWDTFADVKVGDLDNWGNIGAQTDDFDGCIYIVVGSTLYKEAPTGGTVATIKTILNEWGTPGAIGGRLICTNGLIVGHSFGGAGGGGYGINKIKNDALFQGVNFCYLLNNTASGFEIVDFDFYSFKTEEDKGTPLMSFTIPSGLVSYQIDGNTYFGNAPEHFKVYSDGFSKTVISGQYNDLRSFDLGVAMYTEDGYETFERGKYILAAVRDGVLRFYQMSNLAASPTTLTSNISTIANSEVGRVETTNYYYPPYFFYSYSGVGTAEFFERSPYASTFSDYSATLPAFDVTVIRTDDRM